MKLIILIAGGRTGSGLLHSLFDGHNQICQLPSEFYYDDFWQKIKKIKKDYNLIGKKFLEEYPSFFNSKKNKDERHDKLGVKKNQFFRVDSSIFLKELKKRIKGKNLLFMPLLVHIHYAYCLAKKESIKNKKYILLHLHHRHRLKAFSNCNYNIIYTVRDPLANISSSFTGNYENNLLNKKYSPKKFVFMVNKVLNAIYDLQELKRKIFVIKLENLHIQNKFLIRKLCRFLKINYSNILLNSTINGLKWWGDAQSKKYLNGLNPNFKNNPKLKYFFKKDINLLNYYLLDQKLFFNYKSNYNNKIKNSFLKYLPLKMEILIWIKLIKQFSIRNILYIPKFWWKRVRCMRKKKLNNKNILVF